MASTVAVKLLAEFFGAFLLMVSILASGGNFLVIGATLGLIVFLIGGISGACVNPAVALGVWYSGSLSTNLLLGYSVVELLGGLSAAYAYKIVG
jgi:aquaporin Z